MNLVAFERKPRPERNSEFLEVWLVKSKVVDQAKIGCFLGGGKNLKANFRTAPRLTETP